jgi:hypothetical protein
MNTIKREGRKPGPIQFRNVEYNGKEYVIGTVLFNYEPVEFVIDKDDYNKVKDRAWHVSSGAYIASTFYTDENIKKEVYIHNLIMNRDLFLGKGQKETVDHINRNGLDNRKENLRIISQSEQNINQSKKKRNVSLPENCGINVNDIPTHIWYVHPNGLHGDRFAIEFKTENIRWKSTSSKKVSLTEKLTEAKEKLAEFYKQYPYLNPTYGSEERNALINSFNEIISL